MPRATVPLTTFTSGELSPRLNMRIDIAKYKSGAKTVENALVMPHGGLRKRPGSIYVAEVKDSTQQPRLVDFQFSTTQAYMLEFGPNYIRFYKDGGIITNTAVNITGITQANPGVVTANAHGFSNGDYVIISSVGGMTQVNNRRFLVAGVTANTFQLSGVNTTGYSAYTSGGTVAKIVELATTYTSGEIDDLNFAQSADTLYIAHQAHKLAKLTRTSHTVWTLTDANITNGPFRSINSDNELFLVLTATGSASISNATQANPVVVTTAAPHGFSEGCTVLITGVVGMVEINNLRFIVRDPTSTTFKLYTLTGASSGAGGGGPIPLNGTGYTAYASGGTATVSQTDFSTFSPGTSVTVSASKALFTANHVGALFRLWEPGKGTGVAQPISTKTVANNDTYTTDGKVYGVKNLTGAAAWDEEWRYPNHEDGLIKVTDTSRSKTFDAVFLHDTSCVLKITAFSNSQNVTAIVQENKHVPRSVLDSGTYFWEEGAWSTERGFPSVITFHESRLWAAGSTADPQTVWASRTGAFEEFQDGADDDDALVYAIASSKVDVVKWLDAGKTLVLGTASGEYSVAASNQNEALTPSNVRIARQTPFGTGDCRPTRISNAVIFAQRNGDPNGAPKKIRELTYSFDVDSYVAPDLTIISEHITGAGVNELAYQASPDSLLWAVRTDGQNACLTYEREQQVVGWHRHILGGAYSGGAAVVERARVIPASLGDQLWLIVKRTVNGSTVRYIEYLDTGLLDSESMQDAIYLDSALTYSGASTSTITGLFHLEGQTVYALVNGAKQGPFTVTSGTITLTSAGTLVHVGLRYQTTIETLDLEAAAVAGTAKSRAKRIARTYLDIKRTLGGRMGPDSSNMDDILYREPSDVMGSPPALRTGLYPLDGFAFPSGWDRKAQIRIEHDEPYHFELLGIAAELNTQG